MSQETKQYFETHAVSFDSIYLDQSPLSRWINNTFRRAVYERYRIAIDAAGDMSGKTALDVGCGSGHYTAELARRGAKRVLSMDLSSNMLGLAKEMVRRTGMTERCEFLQADFLQHQFQEKFDVIIAMGVFDYIKDPKSFLKKMVNHSRGIVVASFPGKSLVRMHIRRFRYQLQNCPIFFYSEEELHTIVRDSGLKDYQLKYMPHSGTGWVLIGRVEKI